MTALIISQFNGRLHLSLDNAPRRRNGELLGKEVGRIPLTASESGLTIDQVEQLYRAGKLDWQKMRRVA